MTSLFERLNAEENHLIADLHAALKTVGEGTPDGKVRVSYNSGVVESLIDLLERLLFHGVKSDENEQHNDNNNVASNSSLLATIGRLFSSSTTNNNNNNNNNNSNRRIWRLIRRLPECVPKTSDVAASIQFARKAPRKELRIRRWILFTMCGEASRTADYLCALHFGVHVVHCYEPFALMRSPNFVDVFVDPLRSLGSSLHIVGFGSTSSSSLPLPSLPLPSSNSHRQRGTELHQLADNADDAMARESGGYALVGRSPTLAQRRQQQQQGMVDDVTQRKVASSSSSGRARKDSRIDGMRQEWWRSVVRDCPNKARQLVRDGLLSAKERKIAWRALCCVDGRLQQATVGYAELLELLVPDACLDDVRVIDVDVTRVFPRSRRAQRCLRRILRAHCALLPSIGYWQGAAFIAATIMRVFGKATDDDIAGESLDNNNEATRGARPDDSDDGDDRVDDDEQDLFMCFEHFVAKFFSRVQHGHSSSSSSSMAASPSSSATAAAGYTVSSKLLSTTRFMLVEAQSRQSLFIVDRLVELCCQRVFTLWKSLSVSPVFFCSSWIDTLFARPLASSPRTLLRLLDLLLVESPNYLFSLIVAAIALHEAPLLRCATFEQAVACCKRMFPLREPHTLQALVELADQYDESVDRWVKELELEYQHDATEKNFIV
jgi:Rab-GTPase-TBC domain/RUN domain